MRGWQLNLSFILAVMYVSSAAAMKVKGLVLGEVATQEKLTAIFGSASCSDNGGLNRKVLGLGEGPPLKGCVVPLSFLGMHTEATIGFGLKDVWAVQSMTIDVPETLLNSIDADFTQRYGAPDYKRGAPYALDDLVNIKDVGNPKAKMHTARGVRDCTHWARVDDVEVDVCGPQPLLGLGPHVRFYYIAPNKLDSSDF